MAFGGKLLRGIVVACKAGGVVAVKFGIKKAAYAAGAGVGMGTIAETSADLSLQFFEEICKHFGGPVASREQSALQPQTGALDPAVQATLRTEIAETAAADPGQMASEMDAAIAEVAPELPAEVKDSLRAYAAILPERVRRTLRRAEDPSGRTIPEGRQFRTVLDVAEVLPPPARFRPGECPVYNRELKRLLGVGTFGEVWEATKRGMMGRRVALKFCLGDERALEHEARLAQRLEHPGIVQLFEIHPRTDNVPLCLEYELVDGPDLAAWYLSRKLSDDDRPKAVANIVASLAQILSVAHNHRSDDGRPEPIVHRDLKPSNILVAKTANGHALKITDFGIGGVVRAAEEARAETQRRTIARGAGSSFTVDAIRAYTPRYAPHEQVAGAAPDPRQDVHALGVIWYQMLRRDFSAPNPSGGAWKRKLRAEGVGDAHLELIESCLDTEASERPRDGAALAEAIRTAGLQESAVTTPAAAPAPSVVIPATPKIVVPQSLPSTRSIELPGGIKLELVRIDAGSFMMGSPASEPERSDAEGPQRTVTFARPFYLGKFQVTQDQWQAVMGSNPARFKGGNLPVESVSWEAATAFCDKVGQGLRLPSEAEWEYACRAGTTTPFYFGQTISPSQANYDGNYTYGSGSKGPYRQKTTSVGTFEANKFGLFDMHGNVWEWCEDVWHDSYAGAPTDGSARTSGGYSVGRVLRGGSWLVAPWFCRSAFRRWPAPADLNRGFRVASGAT